MAAGTPKIPAQTSEVAIADFSDSDSSSLKAGTMTTPPPIPNSIEVRRVVHSPGRRGGVVLEPTGERGAPRGEGEEEGDDEEQEMALAGGGVGEQRPADHREQAGGRGGDDQAPVDQAFAAVAEGAGDRPGEDRGEGGAHRDQGGGAEGPEAGVADDGAADAEQGAQHPGEEAEEEREHVARQPGVHGR
jgi:hypothetical protein